MKELTIEEKAKRYDEAIKLAKDSFNYPDYPGFIRADVVFPELKESEDERIRKWLIALIKSNEYGSISSAGKMPCPKQKVLDWLEKQGEQKPVVPKFKVGDTIRFKGNETLKGETETHKIISYDNELYVFADGTTDLFCEQDLYELVEQKSAEPIKGYDFHGVNIVPKFKKGDLIREKNSGKILTVKEFSFNTGLYTYDTGQFPITIQNNYELVEQKHDWTEEDETKIKSIIALLKSPALCAMDGNKGIINESIKYLKSLKDKVIPQTKQEWSEEDTEMIDSIIDTIDTNIASSDYHEIVTWLKSLKERYTLEAE